jgi:hypothetical protein
LNEPDSRDPTEVGRFPFKPNPKDQGGAARKKRVKGLGLLKMDFPNQVKGIDS